MCRHIVLIGVLASLLSGCVPSQIIGDGSLLVTTPTYRANKIFYVCEPNKPGNNGIRCCDLKEPYELVTRSPALSRPVRDGGPVASKEPNELVTPSSKLSRPVRNAEPVTIIVNRAYIPEDASSRRRTRDIAVLLDVGMRAGQDEQFVAVWYQRDVPADELLSFQDLVVYNEDSWDNRVPPYFRIRLVDVTTERNAATAEMLNQVAQLSGTLSSLTSSPLAGSALSVGVRAARLILANKRNRALIDYTFHLYSVAQTDEAGGMPLGFFRTGGFMVVGLPMKADNNFWNAKFQYDHRGQRVQKGDGKTVEAPFVLATVMTAEAVIPTVVKRRSERIAQVLSDQKTVRTEISEVIKDTEFLQAALNALKMREQFCRFPSKESFQAFLQAVELNWEKMPDPEKDWLLSSLRTITQVGKPTIKEYVTWYEECGRNIDFDPEARKFQSGGNTDVKDKSRK